MSAPDHIVDRLVGLDPATPDYEGWGSICFFCEAAIERGHEQHTADCLWAVARQLRGLSYLVEKPARPDVVGAAVRLVDTGSLRKSLGFKIE